VDVEPVDRRDEPVAQPHRAEPPAAGGLLLIGDQLQPQGRDPTGDQPAGDALASLARRGASTVIREHDDAAGPGRDGEITVEERVGAGHPPSVGDRRADGRGAVT
jgi:hypothetical protein